MSVVRNSQLYKSRPPGWTREAVLRRLETGESINGIIRSLAPAARVAATTLSADLKAWRRSDPEYDAKVVAAIEKRMGGGFIEAAGSGRTYGRKFDEEAQDDLLKAMEENGGRVADAAATVGVPVGLVYDRLRRRSQNFNQVFYDRFMELESVRISGIRESFLDDAKENSWAAHKVLEAHPSTSELHNPKRLIELEAHHTHTHRLDPAMMEQIASRRAKFFGMGRVDGEADEHGLGRRVEVAGEDRGGSQRALPPSHSDEPAPIDITARVASLHVAATASASDDP